MPLLLYDKVTGINTRLYLHNCLQNLEELTNSPFCLSICH